MISINELRINNWVNVLIWTDIKDTKVVRLGRVKALSSNIVVEYMDSKEPVISEESSTTLEPVALTRAWLKRAHFRTIEDTEKFETMQFDRFEVSYYKENGSITVLANNVYLRKCPHVHTFQNLYRSLMDSELWF